MNSLFEFGVLFAEKSRLDNLSDTFRGRTNPLEKRDLAIALCVLAGVIGLVWLLSRLRPFRQRAGSYDSPLRLFLALCSAHRLRCSQRWLLWRLARARQLADPARLFLEPEHFDPANLGERLRSRAGEYESIRRNLFAAATPSGPEAVRRGPGGPIEGAKSAPLPPLPSCPALDVPPWVADAGQAVNVP